MAVASVYWHSSKSMKPGMDELQLIVTELTLHADNLIIADGFHIG